MSNQVFRQNLDDKKGPQPGGPYLIQMLFKEPVDMPDKDEMTAVMKKHIGAVECFCRDKRWQALLPWIISRNFRTANARCS